MKTRDKLMSYLLLSALVVAVLVTISSASSDDKVDCLYLLVLLDKVLDYAVKGDPVGEFMSRYVINATGFGGLHDLHVSAYTAILDYYAILRAASTAPLNTATKAYKVLEGLNDIRNYASRLSTCSHIAEATKALSVSISTKLSNLREFIYMSITMAYQDRFAGVYQVHPLKEVYFPGEVIEITVPREAPVETVEAYAWPGFFKVRDFSLRDCSAVYCTYVSSMPTAVEVERLGLREYLIDRVLTVSVFAKLSNGSYLGVYLAAVRYDLPRVQVDLPSTVKRGSVLGVKVSSEDFYNATLRLNGFGVLNTTLKPGTSVFVLDPAYYTLGLNVLEICIETSIKTLSHCYNRTFVTEPVYPRVSVSLQDFALAWSGFLTLTVSNADVTDVHAVVDVGVFKQAFTVPSGCVKQVDVFTGILPVQGLNVKVSITALQGSYDELETSKNVYVINVVAIVFLIPVSMLLPISISGYEKSFIAALIRAWKKYTPVAVRRIELEVGRLLKPYKLGLDSHIALLYYELMRRLKIRMPYLHETLREHFTEISESPLLSPTSKKLMRRMLLTVERDLYSSKKPPIEEARKLYEDVLNAARER